MGVSRKTRLRMGAMAEPSGRRLVLCIFLALFFAAFSRASDAQALFGPDSIAQGDPLLYWMASPAPFFDGEAFLYDGKGKLLQSARPFFMPSQEGTYLYGILMAVPMKAVPGSSNLSVQGWIEEGNGGKRQVSLQKPLAIDAKKFLKEDIPLDKANTDLRVKPDPQKTAESLSFAKIFEAQDLTALFPGGPMARPLTGTWRETAGFGDERRYLYFGGGNDVTVHGGVDLGAKEGTEVLACAAGRVVFAGLRIVTGNTVVVEHLPGLFSIYMHLSGIAVKEGDIIDRGEKIGSVGSTGLSTGPHLHWELRIGETPVNPYYWLMHPLLDKEFISSTIKLPIQGR